MGWSTLASMDSGTVLVFGGSGLLGQELLARMRVDGARTLSPSSSEVPFDQPDAIRHFVAEAQPDVIVNAAAYTDVDGAEREISKARQVNAIAVKTLVDLTAQYGSRLIQVSTASVFDGHEGEVFAHDAPLNPLNSYNRSKAEGELYCLEGINSGLNVAVVRTYWLYGRSRGSFVDFAYRQLAQGEPLTVVADQWGQPTNASDLAAGIANLVGSAGHSGVFHGVNSGAASRLQLVEAIADIGGFNSTCINPVRAADFSAPAPRPTSCVLVEEEPDSPIGQLRPWREALSDYLKMLN